MTAWGEVPAAVRRATVACLVLGAYTAVMASAGLNFAYHSGALTADALSREGPNAWLAQWQDEPLRQANRAVFEAQLAALVGMRLPRMAVLALLSLSASLVFWSALWLRWPGELPRAAVARALGLACLATALLRTLEGAMDLVVTRKAALAQQVFLAGTAYPAEGVTATVTALSVGFTFLVVAGFVGLGTWLRSEAIQATLEG